MNDKFINRLIIACVAVLVFSLFIESDLKRMKEQKEERPVVTIPKIDKPSEQNNVRRLNKVLLADNHDYQFCKDISIAEVKNDDVVYYQWLDKNGQLQVADKKPDGIKATKVTRKGNKEKFKLTINDEDHVVPQKIRAKLEVGLRRTYEIYQRLLPKDSIKNAEVNIIVFSDRNKYESYAKTLLPDIKGLTDGFYFKPKNQAVVYYRSLDQVLAVSLHEATHLINATIIGITPRWLNEGLAEYFEKMRVFNQAAIIDKSEDWPYVLKNNPVELNKLIRISSEEWNGGSRIELYANSWSFIYFMMEDKQRRKWLGYYLSSVAKEYCKPFNHIKWLENNYSGGVAALNEEWKSWLSQGGGVVSHQY